MQTEEEFEKRRERLQAEFDERLSSLLDDFYDPDDVLTRQVSVMGMSEVVGDIIRSIDCPDCRRKTRKQVRRLVFN